MYSNRFTNFRHRLTSAFAARSASWERVKPERRCVDKSPERTRAVLRHPTTPLRDAVGRARQNVLLFSQDGGARIGQMLHHRLLGRRRIMCPDAFIQLPVECQLFVTSPRDVVLDLPASSSEKRNNACDPPLQGRIFGSLSDEKVESSRLPVDGPTASQPGLHLIKEAFHLLQLSLRGAAGRECCNRRFDDLAGFEEVEEGIFREEGPNDVGAEESVTIEGLDPVAEARLGLHHAQQDKVLKGFSNGGTADSELLHERLLSRQTLTRRKVTGFNLGNEMICDGFRQGGAF